MGIFQERKNNKGEEKTKIILKKINSLIKYFEINQGSFDLEKIFKKIDEQLKECEIMWLISIYNKKDCSIVLRHTHLLDLDLNEKEKKIEQKIFLKNLSCYKKVLKEKKGMICDGVHREILTLVLNKSEIDNLNDKKIIVVPLIIRQEVIGFFEFISSDFSRDDLALFIRFSNQFTTKISNSILYNEIKISEKKYRNLFEKADESLFVFNGIERKFVDVNQRLCDITSYTKEKLLKIESLKFFAKDERKRVEQYISQRLKNGVFSGNAPIKYEVKILTARNETRIAELHVLQEINKGEWFVSLRDVTESKKVEKKLIESEKKYRSLFNHIVDPVVIYQKEKQKFLECNNAALKKYGYTLEEFRKMSFHDLYFGKNYPIIRRKIDDISQLNSNRQIHYTKSGEAINVETNVDEMEYKGEKVLICIIRDITKQAKIESDLHESKKKYQDLLENISDVIYSMDSEGKVTFVNKPGLEKFGYCLEEIKGSYFIEFIHEDDREKLLNDHNEMIKTKRRKTHNLQFRLVGKNKIVRWVEMNSQNDFKNDSYLGERGVIRDVTGRIEAERKNKESKEKYRMLVNNAGESVIVVNLKGYITFANKSFFDTFDYRKEDLEKIHFSKMIHPDDYNFVAINFNKRISGREVVRNYEFRIIKKNNEIKTVSYTGSVIKKNGKIVGVLAVIRDISENKDLLKKIEHSKKHYEQVIDTIQDGICVINSDFKIQSCNKVFAEKVGVHIKNIKGMMCKNTIPFYENSLFKDHCARKNCIKVCSANQVFKTGKAVAYIEKNLDKKGKMHYHSVNEFPTKEKNGKVSQVVMIFRDVTERIMIQEKNRVLSEFNKRILDNVPVSIIVLDKSGLIISANKLALKYIGKSEKDTLNRKIIKTENIKSNKEIVEKYKKLCLKGEPFYISNMSYKPEKNQEKMYLNIIAVPLFDENNNIDGAISMALNNTEAVLAKIKLEEMNWTLEQQVKERTSALDDANKELSKVLDLKLKFISDASHELRTPLTIIQGNLDLSMNEAKLNSVEIPEMFFLMNKEVKNMTNILSDLTMITNFDANSVKIKIEIVDPILLTLDVRQSLNVLAKNKNIKILCMKKKYKKLLVKGDEMKLESLLMNIVRNAIKYTPQNGVIKIWVEKDKEEVRIIVEDNGIGIPEEDLPYIFERFYRVDKARGRDEGGTGLGLSICKIIAELHGGHISVESKIKKGSKFTLHLPVNLKKDV